LVINLFSENRQKKEIAVNFCDGKATDRFMSLKVKDYQEVAFSFCGFAEARGK